MLLNEAEASVIDHFHGDIGNNPGWPDTLSEDGESTRKQGKISGWLVPCCFRLRVVSCPINWFRAIEKAEWG